MAFLLRGQVVGQASRDRFVDCIPFLWDSSLPSFPVVYRFAPCERKTECNRGISRRRTMKLSKTPERLGEEAGQKVLIAGACQVETQRGGDHGLRAGPDKPGTNLLRRRGGRGPAYMAETE